MGPCIWWGKNILLGVLSVFFLIFGIETLIGAFSLSNPLEFIMYFFSASFMTLISLVGIIYPAFKIHAWLRPRKADHER